eukprot:TRINITY_DN1064_c0_g2_i2.p1 TRINITY_DN1064_c0_g2~~TRINITY_DN1064_c0_g2_i2.p1  ORF type:complete len:365 (-),score=65.66 TRINITY_DN1064_c0_g2_i2:66-1160(-)
MEIEQNQFGKAKFVIQDCKDKDFDLATCFENKFKVGEGYEKDEDHYFDSYSHFSIHEDMLKDRVRTEAYQKAIYRNKHLFNNKIVLDVGCGTGILSLFAARAGAKHVYSIEKANIVYHAKQIVKENNLEDTITIIQGKVEQIELPVSKVDIIISEWMGYMLLYESMLDSVLFARDKWLVKGGMLFPDKACIKIAAIEDEEYKDHKFNFWNDVYGYEMKNIKKWALMEPVVDRVDKKQIISTTCKIFEVNLETVKIEDLQFSNKYSIKFTKKEFVYALVAWFDVQFTHGSEILTLTTSPYERSTHWAQSVYYLEQFLPIDKDNILQGSFAIKKNQVNERELDIKISYHLKNDKVVFDKQQYYRLA